MHIARAHSEVTYEGIARQIQPIAARIAPSATMVTILMTNEEVFWATDQQGQLGHGLVPRARLYRVGQKSKPDNFCNNVVYCQPIFVIFGTDTL